MATTSDFKKDPDAILDYSWDWVDWLESGETISTSLVVVSAGINLDSSSASTTKATAWISGGTAGVPYLVTNRITTNLGRQDDRTITIRVTPR